jgi:hypothetical protein
MGAFICAAKCAESSAMERDETCAKNHGTLADSELEAVAGGFGGGFPTSFLAMTTVGAYTEATWTPRTYRCRPICLAASPARALVCMDGEDDEQELEQELDAQFQTQRRSPRA